MGDKLGKSAGNAVWLSASDTSPFTLYQYWIRMSDADAAKMLKLFNFNTIGFIEDLVRQHNEKPELRLLQTKLAEDVCLLVHGKEGLNSAKSTSKALYGGSVEALSHLNTDEISKMFNGADIIELMPDAGMSIIDMSLKIGCFPSKS